MSIGANIREAQNAESKAVIHKFKIAAKEIEETTYWLELCKFSDGYPNAHNLIEQLNNISRIINKIIITSKLKYFPNYPISKLTMLSIKNLHASIEDKAILKGINLQVNAGEVHAIMGPNGAGKSTLSSIIAGNENYTVTDGEIILEGEDISDFSVEERAHKGVFLSFQYPVEIPGVSVTNFIKTAINETRKANGKEDMLANEMLKLIREKSELLEIDRKFLSRSLNEGFSGGEKKRNEIFQMAMLEPKLAILDETDSGLDIDALRIVANGVNKLKNENNAVLVITHYQRLLDYIIPDFVHVLMDGKIVKSGGKELAYELEEKGYDWIKSELEV